MKVIATESPTLIALTEQIAGIAAHVRAVSGGRKKESPDRLLTTREMVHLLNMSCRTLQCMRSEQRIAYAVLCDECCHRQSEIDRLLEDSIVTGDAVAPEQVKHSHTLRAGGKPKGRRTWDMGLLTHNNLENWMQKVMEWLGRQDRMLPSMQPSGKVPGPMDGIKLFDNQDLCMLFWTSRHTLQRYRSIGALPYKTLDKRTYYSEVDMLTSLSECIKDFRKEDIVFYKVRTHSPFQE